VINAVCVLVCLHRATGGSLALQVAGMFWRHEGHMIYYEQTGKRTHTSSRCSEMVARAAVSFCSTGWRAR